jgi:hypothetical protein
MKPVNLLTVADTLAHHDFACAINFAWVVTGATGAILVNSIIDTDDPAVGAGDNGSAGCAANHCATIS